MIKRPVLLALAALCTATHAAEEIVSEEIVSEESPLFLFDAFRTSAYGNFGMEFDRSPGELDAWQAELHTFLSKPISLGRDISLLPTFRYEGTFLRYDGTLPGFPVGDEDLHSLEFPIWLLHSANDSPWICGAWLKPSLSSDFDHIDSDDIFVDAAVGAGYKFSDSFYLGGGVALFDAFGNESLIPGPAFLWAPREDLRFQLLGPAFTATWDATPDWRFSFDVRSAGGVWNIDDNNQSRTLDFSSYRAGLHVHRRICETWWVEGGTGITFGNEIELTTPDGLGLNEAVLGDLDEGVFGYLAVKKEVW
jgi:hypothetical protein